MGYKGKPMEEKFEYRYMLLKLCILRLILLVQTGSVSSFLQS